ncbi:MAG: 3-dehydroquinate synthase [Luminiphilus sp.]|jgi:3-dehydroquinate synthase|nr:3-dehydroquinate synthase [Luminiphilus sp.]
MAEALHTVHVNLAADSLERSYPIEIGRGLLTDTSRWQQWVGGRGVVLVTDDQVGPHYAASLHSALGEVGRFTTVQLPAGEQHKHMGTVQQILDAALGDRHERQSLFIALGGGVIGDMTGFAAACFLRGADFIQVPTTLLAQVDSSVGGKTGVNHAMGKNLIGAFHQPRRVVVDLDTLGTLPEREYVAGLAEVIKYGLIRDSAFFDWLIQHASDLKARHLETVATAVRRSCEVKAAVVAEDERESGARAHLNFGHTFGHAIERIQGYGQWLHGEAVAAGMVMAARLSSARGAIEPATVAQLIDFNQSLGLPIGPPPGVTASKLLDAMSSDKKVAAGKVRYILLQRLGSPVITESVTKRDIEGLIDA